MSAPPIPSRLHSRDFIRSSHRGAPAFPCGLRRAAAIVLVLATQVAPAVLAKAAGAVSDPPQHVRYDELLRRYVRAGGVDYDAWQRSEEDLQALRDYVADLELVPVSALEQDPSERDGALAYWINLYNAATLRLVLDNYPIDSIKDIGGLFSSPWDRHVVTVEGEKLTLNEIENDIIRARFRDPRIHFALNCAARSCPPLRAGAYLKGRLDEQLEEQTREFLGDSAHNRIEGDHYVLSKIFDWYREDFETVAGSVGAFVRPYLAKDGKAPADDARVKYLGYDWALNDANEGP